MKKAAALLCAFAVLISGCGRRDRKAPEPTPEPTAAPTAAPTPTPTPEPTPTPTPEPTPEPTPCWVPLEKEETYLLFVGSTAGGKALGAWLMSGGADLTAEFVNEKIGEPMFRLTFTPREETDIPSAGEETRYIRFATDDTVMESGLLEALLPVFESRYGYMVEIYTGDRDDIASWAGSGWADAALLSESGSKGLSHRGFSGVTAWAETSFALVK